MFIPRVKQEKTFDSYRLTTYVKVYFADATAKSVLPAITELMPYLKLKVLDTKKNADFVFETRAGISDKAEYYELSSDLGKLFVSAKDRRGHKRRKHISFLLIYPLLKGLQTLPSKALIRTFLLQKISLLPCKHLK